MRCWSVTFPVPVFSMLARPSRRDQNVCTYCTARQTFLPQGRKLEGVSALSLLSDKKLCLIFIDSFLCWLILRLICYEIESYRGPTPSYVWLSDLRQGWPRFNSRSMETTPYTSHLLVLFRPLSPPEPQKENDGKQ